MGSEKYVLIVDDDPDARQILVAIMSGLGIACETAQDGQEALQKINAFPPDLVLLDLMMPGMSGFEVLFRLRATPATRYIPVIAVSALSHNELLKLPGVDKVVCKAEMRVADVRALVESYIHHAPPEMARHPAGRIV